jgi:hypothetical protein
MKLVDHRDENGVSIQAYVDTLVEKVNAQADMTLVVIIARPPDQLTVKHNIADATALPDILSQFAAQMRKHAKSYTKEGTDDSIQVN